MRAPVRLCQPDENDRRLHCSEQSFCLGVAASMDWPGMSCEECPGYKDLTPAEHRRDLEGLALLWQMINEPLWMGRNAAPSDLADKAADEPVTEDAIYRTPTGWRRTR